MKKNLYLPAMIFLLSFINESLLTQEPCDVKKEFDAHTAEVRRTTEAFNKATRDATGKTISKPTKPTGDGGAPLNKATLEQALKTAKDARSKTEATNNEAESTLRQANEAVTKFKNDPQKEAKLATLKSDIAKLEAQIKKAEDAKAKVSDQDKIDLSNLWKNEIMPLVVVVRMQMPGLSLDYAKMKVEDKSYEGFSNEEIDAIRRVIKQRQGVIKTINEKHNSGTGTPTEEDDHLVREAEQVIKRKESELKLAIEKCRNQVLEDLKPLRRKELEYSKLEEKIYPDQETRELIANLPKMSNDLSAKKLEEKLLSSEQKKLQDAVKIAKAKVEGGTKDGKSFAGSKKAYDEDEKKVKAIEGNLAKLEMYEKNNKWWAGIEKPKIDAEQKVKNITPDFNKAVTAKNAALAAAQTAAALKTLDTRLATKNSALAKEASDEVLANNSRVAENKKKIEDALKTANDEQKKALRLRWKNYFVPIAFPHYIRKRNQAEADRLQAIIDDATLQKFNCFDDVAAFINLLGQTKSEVLGKTASLVSDMDSGIPAGGDDLIPIPPLIEDKEDDFGFDYSKVSGNWESDWGPVQLNVSQNSVSGSWKQSATETGQITGGSFDAKTKTLKFTYSQSWNKKTGKVTFSFSETPTGYSLSGSWGHDDKSNSGSWGMTKKK